jgi:hypothetical protein
MYIARRVGTRGSIYYTGTIVARTEHECLERIECVLVLLSFRSELPTYPSML